MKIIFSLVGLMFFLCGCGYTSISATEERTETHEKRTGAFSTVEERTEERTEASYKQVTEAAENKALTEKPTEETATEASYEEPKIVFMSEYKNAERIAISTEEITGEVDENGYGWVQLQYSAPYNIWENRITRDKEAVDYAGHKETWRSIKEATGQVTAVSIPGKHVADDGTIRDENGYVCVASSDSPIYSIVMTTVGPGKVYDDECSSGTMVVYTNW